MKQGRNKVHFNLPKNLINNWTQLAVMFTQACDYSGARLTSASGMRIRVYLLNVLAVTVSTYYMRSLPGLRHYGLIHTLFQYSLLTNLQDNIVQCSHRDRAVLFGWFANRFIETVSTVAAAVELSELIDEPVNRQCSANRLTAIITNDVTSNETTPFSLN